MVKINDKQHITKDGIIKNNPTLPYSPRLYDTLLFDVEQYKRNKTEQEKLRLRSEIVRISHARGPNFRNEILNFMPIYNVKEKDLKEIMGSN